jgi:DNA-binding transcriptional ArsR family regulator
MSRAAARKPSPVSLAEMAPRAEEAAAMLSALANPKRLLVLCSLVEKERSVGELAELVDLRDAALSQHLAKMRALGLVRTRRDGQTIYYSLASEDVSAVLETLHRRFCQPR